MLPPTFFDTRPTITAAALQIQGLHALLLMEDLPGWQGTAADDARRCLDDLAGFAGTIEGDLWNLEATLASRSLPNWFSDGIAPLLGKPQPQGRW